jgi:hypothetical protein
MLQPTKGWSVLSLAMNAADSQIVVAGTDDRRFPQHGFRNIVAKSFSGESSGHEGNCLRRNG